MGEAFGLPVVRTADMLLWQPALDLLPLAKAFKRHALLMRDSQAQLVAVIDDPLDTNLQTWMESCAHQYLRFHLALRADIHACLNKIEENARATDTLGECPQAPSRDERAGDTSAVLSLANMSESASPAVKLVNSFCTDAFKVGASDVHIESTPSGFSPSNFESTACWIRP